MSTDSFVTFLPRGAIIQSLHVGTTNIVQGFPSDELYVKHNAPYFGETIGRVANRIANANIDSLNGGRSYALAANNGPNNLHGGNSGWGKKLWDGPAPVGVQTEVAGLGTLDHGGEKVKFSLVSPDGDEGFPGTVEASVVYTAGKQKQDGKDVNVLVAEYEAELVDGAEETVINMTNHSYFNLTGGPSIEGTVLTLCTNQYLPVDSGGIPTGGPMTFSQVPEANKPFTIGATEPDIDDCFVVNESPETVPLDTRSEPLKKLVTAVHPASNIHLEIYSTEPAFQLYLGKYIDVPEVEGVKARAARSAFCVEPSRYVNACNVDDWKNMVLLTKGAKYGSRFIYRWWQE